MARAAKAALPSTGLVQLVDLEKLDAFDALDHELGDLVATLDADRRAWVEVDREILGRLRGEYLNGYRIGSYPAQALRGLAIYRPPVGFVEVTRENENTFVSPHFQLKQFLCKRLKKDG